MQRLTQYPKRRRNHQQNRAGARCTELRHPYLNLEIHASTGNDTTDSADFNPVIATTFRDDAIGICGCRYLVSARCPSQASNKVRVGIVNGSYTSTLLF